MSYVKNLNQEERTRSVTALVTDAVCILGALALQGRQGRLPYARVVQMQDQLFEVLELLNNERILEEN